METPIPTTAPQLSESEVPITVHDKRVVRINQRLVLLALLMFLVAGASMHVVHEVQADRNSTALKSRAAAARKEGDLRKAVQALSQYIKFRPNDIDALADLGNVLNQLSTDRGTQTRAFLTWEEVLRRDPERKDRNVIRRQIVDVAMRIGRWSDALLHLKLLRQRDSSNAELASLAAICQEASGKYRLAVDGYLTAIDLQPTKIDYYAQLVTLLSTRPAVIPNRPQLQELAIDSALKDHFPERDDGLAPGIVAERFLETMVDRGQPTYRAHMARCAYLRERGRLTEADEDMAKAIELAGQDSEVRLMAAELALARANAERLTGGPDEFQRLIGQARNEARQGLKLKPSDLRFELVLSQIEQQAGNISAAERNLRNGLERLPALRKDATPDSARQLADLEVQFQWNLADLLITESQRADGSLDAAKVDAARAQIEQLRRAKALAPWVDFLDTRILFLREDWQLAAAKLEKIRAELQRLPDLIQRIDLFLGLCYERLANPDARLAVFRRAFSSNALWIPGRLQLAAALVAEQRIDEAIEAYQVLSGVIGVPAVLARLLIQKQLALPAERRDWTNANRVLELLEKTSPDAPELPAFRAEILEAERKYDAAEQLLVAARDRQPKEVVLWVALIGLALHREDREPATRLDEAARLLEAAHQKVGDNEALIVASGERALLQNSEQAKETLAKLESTLSKLDKLSQGGALNGLAKIALRTENVKLATQFWEREAKLDPRNLEVRIILAELALRRPGQGDDNVEFKRWLQEIRGIEGSGGANGNYLEASRQLKRITDDSKLRADKPQLPGLLAGPRELLLAAKKQRPLWAAIPRALGSMELLLDRRDAAVPYFREAFDLGDRSREVIGFVVEYYREHQKLGTANELLAQVATEDPALISGDLARLAWQVAWQRQQFDDALSLARTVYAGTGDYRDKIWNGHLLWARYQMLPPDQQKNDASTKMLKDARELYKGAVEVASDQPSAWFAYIFHLVEVNDLTEAEAALESARQKLPDTPPQVRPLNLARYLELLKKPDLAEEQYRKAVEVAPDEVGLRMIISDFFIRRGSIGKAAEHLEKILDPLTKAPEFAVSWAKVRQALAVASRGNFDDQTEALNLLKKAMSGGDRGTQIENLRAQAGILSQRATHPDRLALIAVFEKLDEFKSLEPAERFELAQVYERTSNWPQARRAIEQLLKSNSTDPAYLAWFVKALLRHEADDQKQWLLASDLVAKLKAIESNSYRSVEVEARLLAARGEKTRAAELIRDQIVSRKPPDSDAPTRDVEQELAVVRAAATLCEEFLQPVIAEQLYRLYAQRAAEPEAIFVVAMFLGRQGEFQRALEICEQAEAKCTPESVAVTAVNVVSLGNPSAAEQARAEALVLKGLQARPESYRVQAALAGLYTATGRNAEAEQLYRRLLQENSQRVAVLNNLAFLLASKAPPDPEAAELISRAIAIAGPLAPLLDTRAIVRLSLQQTKGALDDLIEAIATEPSAVLYFHLAEAQFQQADQSTARKTLLRAIEEGLNLRHLHLLEQGRFRKLAGSLNLQVGN